MGFKRPQVRLLSLGPENGLKLRFQAIFFIFPMIQKTIKIAVKNGRCYGVATFFLEKKNRHYASFSTAFMRVSASWLM